jgi:hypothetical protein
MKTEAQQERGDSAHSMVVILYDHSGSLWNRGVLMPQANDYIHDILFNEKEIKARSDRDSVMNALEQRRKIGLPLWRAGDCVSLYRFGMEQQDLQHHLLWLPHGDFFRAWRKALIHPSDPQAVCPRTSEEAQQWLDGALPPLVCSPFLVQS